MLLTEPGTHAPRPLAGDGQEVATSGGWWRPILLVATVVTMGVAVVTLVGGVEATVVVAMGGLQALMVGRIALEAAGCQISTRCQTLDSAAALWTLSLDHPHAYQNGSNHKGVEVGVDAAAAP